MKKILVIGIKGMAGHVILNYFKSLNQFEVFGIARNIDKDSYIFDLDISNTEKLRTIIEEHDFDYIINCVGVLNKDAENNPAKAIWYNGFFPHFIEEVTKDSSARVIHISTDCVFSGSKGSYTEKHFKDGIGFYAQSKAIGEIVNVKDTTIRTSIIGPELNSNGIGLLNWFLIQPQQAILKGYAKAFWTGLTTLELAKVIHQIILQNITGLIQVVPAEKISKYELLLLFNKIFRSGMMTVLEDDQYQIDKSLTSIRSDFNYSVPTYSNMLQDQKDWMLAYPKLYKHYTL